MSFWFDDAKRLQGAKLLQEARIRFLEQVWSKDKDLKAEGFSLDDAGISQALSTTAGKINTASKVGDLLQIEALFTKKLYKMAANRTQYGDFVREREAQDTANAFLNHGNYPWRTTWLPVRYGCLGSLMASH